MATRRTSVTGCPTDARLDLGLETCLASPSPLPSASLARQWSSWSGTKLVTSSGDTTVRIWDFAKGGCILTLQGHSYAVWDCSWHSCGHFVASASMDKTSKVWDLNSFTIFSFRWLSMPLSTSVDSSRSSGVCHTRIDFRWRDPGLSTDCSSDGTLAYSAVIA
ncbi:Sperm-associated antigen 16 protein [Varanus komodoensis]|nr:Sperm-associated antigen 16 protein [Varanus komodoensis]